MPSLEWTNVQDIFHQVASLLIADFAKEKNAFFEKHVQIYCGLSTSNKYNTVSLAKKLKDALLRLSKSHKDYANLAKESKLRTENQKAFFMEGLCDLLASEISCTDALFSSNIANFKPKHVTLQNDIPLEINIVTKLIENEMFVPDVEDLFGDVSTASDGEISTSEDEDGAKPARKYYKKTLSDDDLGTPKKLKKEISLHNLDCKSVSPNAKRLLNLWSKDDIDIIQAKKKVLENIVQFIDKIERNVGQHVNNCSQCEVHCFSQLAKKIHRVQGRPTMKK